MRKQNLIRHSFAVIAGVVLLLSFQNCGKSGFKSVDNSASNSNGQSGGSVVGSYQVTYPAASYKFTINGNLAAFSASLTPSILYNGSLVPNSGGTWTFSASSLPQGMSIDPSTGEIIGVPTAISAAQNYTVQFQDGTQTLQIRISLEIDDVAPNLSYGATSIIFSANSQLEGYTTLNPVNPSGTITDYYLGGGASLPAGLSFSATTGVISTSPVAQIPPTQFQFCGSDSGGNSCWPIWVWGAIVPSLASGSNLQLLAGQAASLDVAVDSNSTGCQALGLPASLSTQLISSSTGSMCQISGTPVSADVGSHTVAVAGQFSGGGVMLTSPYADIVLSISSSSSSNASSSNASSSNASSSNASSSSASSSNASSSKASSSNASSSNASSSNASSSNASSSNASSSNASSTVTGTAPVLSTTLNYPYSCSILGGAYSPCGLAAGSTSSASNVPGIVATTFIQQPGPKGPIISFGNNLSGTFTVDSSVAITTYAPETGAGPALGAFFVATPAPGSTLGSSYRCMLTDNVGDAVPYLNAFPLTNALGLPNGCAVGFKAGFYIVTSGKNGGGGGSASCTSGFCLNLATNTSQSPPLYVEPAYYVLTATNANGTSNGISFTIVPAN